jgi:hypothetical protein
LPPPTARVKRLPAQVRAKLTHHQPQSKPLTKQVVKPAAVAHKPVVSKVVEKKAVRAVHAAAAKPQAHAVQHQQHKPAAVVAAKRPVVAAFKQVQAARPQPNKPRK